jgi:RNA polymerase sigma-70 factor (ECF subfamily)
MVLSVDENLLIKRILEGHVNEYQIVIDNYKKLVGHIVFKMIKNEADREDICQDVFVKAYKNLGSFKFESKLSTWIGRIAYNTSINYLEKKKMPLLDDIITDDSGYENIKTDSISPEDLAENRNVSDILKREVDKLPPHYRTIITLYHLDEMTYKEISDITKLPEGTVKSNLFRARKLLKTQLEIQYNKEDLCQ